MNAEVGIDAHSQMDMIGHHCEFFDLGLMLFTHLTDGLFQSLLNRRKEHLPALFRTPDPCQWQAENMFRLLLYPSLR
jgi:hypothetical protein